VAVAALLAACSADGEPVDAPDIGESAPVQPVAEPEGDSQGLTEERIVFGQSAALSGPAEELGINMRLGILAAFDEVNAAGGVHGRVLELRSLDDAYEPEDAIPTSHPSPAPPSSATTSGTTSSTCEPPTTRRPRRWWPASRRTSGSPGSA